MMRLFLIGGAPPEQTASPPADYTAIFMLAQAHQMNRDGDLVLALAKARRNMKGHAYYAVLTQELKAAARTIWYQK